MKSLSDCTASRPLAWSFWLLPLAFPRVPLAVPYWSHETYRAILRSISSLSVIEGPDLFALKTLLNEKLGVEEVVLCSSGSLALELALRACGVGRGDEVVLPTFCCTSVIPPILAAGGLPVLADCADNLNLSAAAVEAVLSNKTRAVLVPHLFGNPADIAAIVDLLRGRNVRVIDDAAQALGATIGGRAVGSFGDAGVLSFGCEKICSGLGGGAAISSDKEIFNGFQRLICRPREFSLLCATYSPRCFGGAGGAGHCRF